MNINENVPNDLFNMTQPHTTKDLLGTTWIIWFVIGLVFAYNTLVGDPKSLEHSAPSAKPIQQDTSLSLYQNLMPSEGSGMSSMAMGAGY